MKTFTQRVLAVALVAGSAGVACAATAEGSATAGQVPMKQVAAADQSAAPVQSPTKQASAPGHADTSGQAVAPNQVGTLGQATASGQAASLDQSAAPDQVMTKHAAPPGGPGPDTPAATALEAAPVLVAGACETPQHHQFDFWLGDWQVFDASSDKLVAFDRVEKHSEGCIVEQNMIFVTDMYRRPGASYRLSGMSVNRYDGEAWLELWADNQWGAIAMRGSPDAKSAMVLETITPSRNRDLKIVWENRADGTVRILQYVATPAGSGRWKKYGDLVYRRNR